MSGGREVDVGGGGGGAQLGCNKPESELITSQAEQCSYQNLQAEGHK